MRVMFMLVGDQTIPNLMPYLELNHENAISEVVLVTTRAAPLEYALGNLSNFLTQKTNRAVPALYRCEVEKLNLQENLAVIREQIVRLREVAEKRGDQHCEFIFNMTSGTKVMALAAYQIAVETGSRLIYLDSDHNQLLDLLPHLQAQPLRQALSIADYTAAYGYQIKSVELTVLPSLALPVEAAGLLAMAPPGAVTRLVKTLLRYGGQPASLEFDDSTNKAELELVRTLDGSLWQLEEIGGGGGGANKSETEPAQVKFKVKWLQPATFFPGGKWLELYAFYCVTRLLESEEDRLHDLAAGVTLLHRQGFENELDLVFSWGHHLAVCSCKTGHKTESQWIYDLNDRARSLGTFCHKVLLLNFDARGAAAFRERARQDKIQLFDQSDLPFLTEHFKKLISHYR